ncbi:MAG: hypothetical protein MIO92_13545 [Methanosarcinaceae archaeon]|nr:hypothetical protein [Methanosarcinaceae archaeon]
MTGVGVGNSCLEKEVKAMMQGFAEKDPGFIMKFIDNLIPDCVAAPAAAAKAASTRKMPAPWLASGGKLVYMDASCKEQEFTSPSAVMNALNIKTSGIQCLADGSTCRVESQIDTLRRQGYTVRSDKGDDVSKGSLLITVIHPDCVKEMAAEKAASSKKRGSASVQREATTRKATPEELASLK